MDTCNSIYSSSPHPCLGPGSAVGKNGKKRGLIGKISAGEASRAVTTSRLDSLADFSPFTLNAEPGTRLAPSQVSNVAVFRVVTYEALRVLSVATQRSAT